MHPQSITTSPAPEIRCNRCLQTLPITAFAPDKRCPKRFNRTTYCHQCRRAAYLERLRNDPAMADRVDRWERIHTAAEVVRAVEAGEMPAPEIRCNVCKTLKPITDFGPNKTQTGRYFRHSTCRACAMFKERLWRLAHPVEHRAKVRRGNLKRLFGLTELEYEQLVMAQGGVCAICRQPETAGDKRQGLRRRLSVDHDHETGRVRGLLCAQCNTGIGKLRHNPKILCAAIAYLKGR